MATRRWKGNAVAVAQVTTIVIADTWATGDTAVITINGKDLTLTVGTDATTANVATAIKEMLNGDTQTGTGDHTFSTTGNLIPEFNEVTATVAGSVVTLTGDTKGKPFTVTVSETTAGTGTVGSPSTTTAATGPNHFDNADNWSGGAVPVDADDVVIDQGSVSIKYGLDQSAVTPTSLTITDGFTGTIGLPEVNADASGSPYFEYRSLYLALGTSSDATNMAVSIGGGEGAGSGRVKLDSGSGQVTINVRNTGPRAEQAVPSFVWKGTHASNAINVNKGDVGVAFFSGEVATVATLRVGYQENQAGDSTVELNDGCTLTAIEQTGGTLTFRDAVTTFDQTGGESFVEGSATVTTLNLDEGECRYKSTGTLTTANVGGGATLDFQQDSRPRTVTNTNLHEGSSYLDPHGSVTNTNGFDFIRCRPSEVTWVVAPHQTFTASSI